MEVSVKKLGKQTICFSNSPGISETASIVSKKEGEGPLGAKFDQIVPDPMWEEASWEKAENKFLKQATDKLLQKSKLNPGDIDYILSGDLINQCTGTSFAIKDFNIPFLGIFGACSTIAEGLLIGSMIIDGDFGGRVIASTSSHFCSAEKQFRTPLEYGGQRPPTAQWTVTGAGALLLEKRHMPPFVTHATVGKIVTHGVKDANNMGAAMAPAFVDTLCAHFNDTGREPAFYDLIVSGDLGGVGGALAKDLAQGAGFDINNNYNDCGCMIFDGEKQDTHAGGSGCACSAVVLCGYILDEMRAHRMNNVLFCATGALMSPMTCMQGEDILGISYAIALSNG